MAPVVQRADNSIHWINYYPVDGVLCFFNIISWKATYPVDSIIHPFEQLGPGLLLKLKIHRFLTSKRSSGWLTQLGELTVHLRGTCLY